MKNLDHAKNRDTTITCDQTDMEKEQIEDIYNIFLEKWENVP